jgi:hypothetical protein
MRIALFLLAAAATVAHADDYRPKLDTLYEFPGFDVVESINDYSHDKGDPGASINYVHIYMRNTDGKEHTVRVTKLELLHAHCNASKWKDRTALPIKGPLVLQGWDGSEVLSSGKDKVVVPAKKDLFSINASFKSINVYNECDKFAFGIAFEVDGKAKAIELEMNITRIEPKK